jgi:hypothetical protein
MLELAPSTSRTSGGQPGRGTRNAGCSRTDARQRTSGWWPSTSRRLAWRGRMPRTAPRTSRATRRPVPRPASSRRAGRGRGATGVRLPGERSRLAGGGNQARLRSRRVTARRRVPQVMRLGGRASGRASVNSQSRDAASRKTTITGESAGQPRMPRFGAPPRYRPAASVRGRQPRPLSLASLALTDPSEYGMRLRPPRYASGYSSGDSPWKATHTG